MAKHPLLNCIVFLSLVLSLSACGQTASPPVSSSPAEPAPQEHYAPTQPLSLAVYADRSFHPILTDNRVNLTLSPLLYEGLFQLDPSFTPQKQLCSAYETSEDGLVWTFSLRQGVTFSDGTPLTAAHVVHSLELARTGVSPYSGRFSCIASIAAQGEWELTITLSRPNTALPALLDIPIVLGNEDYPLGTGPYVLTRQGDDSLALVPRDNARPTIPLIRVTDTQELTNVLDRGALSLLVTDPSGTDSPAYSGTCRTVDYDTTSLIYLGFNTVKSPFHSASARIAAAAALDRGALVSAAWSGHARAAVLPIHPASPLYDESLARRLPSPDNAGELARQSGLANRHISLIVNRENSSKVAAAHLVASQLEQQADLSVTVSELPWEDYLNALSNGLFDLYLGEVALTADFDLTPLLSTGGTLNYSRWYSDETDRLLREFLCAEQTDRAPVTGLLCTHLAEQMPIAPLCFKRGSVLTLWSRADELTPTRANVFYGLYE